MYFIFINTLEDGRFKFSVLSRLGLNTTSERVSMRMADLAAKHFGDQAIHIKDKTLLGYWAHKDTGQTIEVSHLAP